MPTLKLLRSTRSQHSHSCLLLIELRFFNELHSFIVDTGADITCISYALFNKFPVSEAVFAAIRTDIFHGAGGQERSQRVPIKINFLGKILNSITIGHFLDEWNKRGFPASGLLGQDVLTQFDKVTIDYLKGEISFT